jgi:two-component system response regulator NreC
LYRLLLAFRFGVEITDKIITVALADGHAISRTALATLIAESDDFAVVSTSESTEEAVSAALGHHPDVIIFDPPLPASADSVATVVERLVVASPSSAIMVLTESESATIARAALLAGAVGYMLKSDDPADLLKVIRRAAEDRPWISPKVANAIARFNRDSFNDDLTPRQREIVRSIAWGFTSQEIADKMHLSVRTIEAHRAKIFRKLNLSSRAELVRFAYENGLFDETGTEPPLTA